jgi:hypothetical protein
MRLIRDWCFGIGFTACGLALASLGMAVINNPSAWAPTGGPSYSGVLVLTGGGLRWLAGPLLVAGGTLLVVSLLLTVVLRKH